jgi:hypothetical protein
MFAVALKKEKFNLQVVHREYYQTRFIIKVDKLKF